MKLNKYLIFLLLTNMLFAQHNTTAKISKVNESGLHKMIVPPELRSYSNEGLSDIRIFDEHQNEVPYFINQENLELNSLHFQEYPILSRTAVSKKQTSIVIENTSAKNIYQIALYIGNSDVIKTYNISGSDNKVEWYGLSNKQKLNNLSSADSTSIKKTISFPLSSYRYLKIDFDDRKTLPINVLKAGNFSNTSHNNPLLRLVPQTIKILQFPVSKTSEIHFTFQNPQIINQIAFDISGPSYYKRSGRIYLNKTKKHKHRVEKYREIIAEIELSSDTKNTFIIPQLFEKELFIEIENQDSPPLNIGEVKVSQIPVSLVADLKLNHEYSIKTGNKESATPQYDLSFFKNSKSVDLPETTIYQIEHLKSKTTIAGNKLFWQSSWFLWTCIAVGGIALLYFSTTLVKEMKNN